jgi:hypothetical protein
MTSKNNEKERGKDHPDHATSTSPASSANPATPAKETKASTGFEDHVWEKYQWEVWLESKGVPLGWWKNTRLEPRVVAIKVLRVGVIALGIPIRFFKSIDWYYGPKASHVYRDAKKGSGG